MLQSSFINPMAGTIYFRQVQGEDVQIWGKVYWINDMPTTMDHNWHIHSVAVRLCTVAWGNHCPVGISNDVYPAYPVRWLWGGGEGVLLRLVL